MRTIDLFSDTATKPSAEMRAFMCAAEVGDEQRGEDPTVNALQEQVAELLGKEAAIYLPSGAMCNQVAFAVHARPGDEIILDAGAHPFNFEGGATALISGAQLRPISGVRGIFDPAQARAAIRQPPSRYAPRSRLVSVEQTTNLGGGAVWPLATIEAVCAIAHEHGLATHLDGARLLNAVVASGVAADRYAAPFDSVWIDFSKGLGAPVGAVLAGTRAFIEEAWSFKQRLGGAMRQAGIIAAGCIYALRHNVDRLRDDHEHARLLGRTLATVPELAFDPATVETNIVVFDVAAFGLDGPAFVMRLAERSGVRLSALGGTIVRAVTHLDVTREDVETACSALLAIFAELRDARHARASARPDPSSL